MFNRFTQEDVVKNNGAVMYGRVKQYIHNDGYGFIYAENGKEIFLSSYELGKKQEDKIAFGTLVSFIPADFEDKIVASKITIISRFPSGRSFCLPNGECIEVKHICKYGYVSWKQVLEKLNQTEDQMLKAGYKHSDLDYVYIRTTREEYRFYNVGSKQTGDGQTDLDALMDKMRNTFLSIY